MSNKHLFSSLLAEVGHCMLKTFNVEDNLLYFSIFSFVKVFLAYKNLYLDFKSPFASRFVCGGPVEWSVWGKQNRSSANQIAGFTRTPNRRNYLLVYIWI